MDAERAVAWQDPGPLAARVGSAAAIDWLRDILSGALPPPSYAQVLGFRFAEVERGRVVLTAEPDDRACNPMGVIAGGYVSGLLDLAMGCAVHSTLPAGALCPSLQASTSFLRGLRPGDGPLRAEAVVVEQGRRVAHAEARLAGQGDRLHATATASFLIVPS